MIRVDVDQELGGRIASIVDGAGRERLWTPVQPARSRVGPGAPFVDAGGVEECFPSLDEPDHGDVWSLPWREMNGALTVETSEARLTRRLEIDDAGFTARYALEAEPGYRFVWAFHALLAPEPYYVVRPVGAEVVLSWPGGYGAPAARDSWPRVGAEPRFDRAGPDDGTAVFALLPGVAQAMVDTPSGTISTCLSVDESQPVSLGLWRNLGGWPDGEPYRSWGIEPMIGRHPRRDAAGAETGIASRGPLAWTLRIDISTGIR